MIRRLHREERLAIQTSNNSNNRKQTQGIMMANSNACNPWHDLSQMERKRCLYSRNLKSLSVSKRTSSSSSTWAASIPIIQEDCTCLQAQNVPPKVQELLKAAACLESLDTQLISAALSDNSDVSMLFATASELGLIVMDGNKNKEYSFVNAETQEAAYRLIPKGQHERFHCTIGRKLVVHLSPDELEKHIYTVLRQFYIGKKEISDHEECKAVASLCRRAATGAVGESSFTKASMYLEFGIQLLEHEGEDAWKQDYDLILALYNSFAEVEYCIANFERMDSLVATVLENARCFRDTLLARATRVYSLGGRGRILEAVEEGLDVLRHLGVTFPSPIRMVHLWMEERKTRRMLRNKTNESILRLPLMQDTDRLAAMQMLNLVFPNAFTTNPKLAFLVASKMVHLSLQHGLSAISSVGFSMYGTMFCKFSDNEEEGYRFGVLALALLNKFRVREWLPRVYFGVWGIINRHRHQLKELVGPLSEAYSVGMETGDIEFAMLNANKLCVYMLLGGSSLPEVEREALKYRKGMVVQKQVLALLKTQPLLKLVQALRGRTGADPEDVFIEALIEHPDRNSQSNKEMYTGWLRFQSMFTKFLLSDHDGAEKDAILFAEFNQAIHARFAFGLMAMVETLALLAVCKNRSAKVQMKYLAHAKRQVQDLQKLALLSPRDCIGKAFLLEAELAAVTGKHDLARCKYICAIAVALENDVALDRALACERAGRYMIAQGDESSATQYLRRAYSCYEAWGATAKLDLLEKEMPERFETEGVQSKQSDATDWARRCTGSTQASDT